MKKLLKRIFSIIRLIPSYFLLIFVYFLGIYIFKIRNKIKIIGKKNLPRTTKILYISNHLTFIDSLLIGIGVLNFKELFFQRSHITWNVPDLKNFYSNKFGVVFMKSLKNIPVNRGSNCINKTIDKYCEILRKSTLVIFPEGGRTKNGILDECKPGVAKTIVLMTEEDPMFKVIPIFLDNINEIMPKEVGQKYFRIKSGKRGKMIIGEAVDFSEICKKNITEKEKIELVKEKVRESILSLRD